MTTSESFANSILIDNRGVHALVWDDKGELVRALIILLAVIDEVSIDPILLSSAEKSEEGLRNLFEIKPIRVNENVDSEHLIHSEREKLLLIFLQQATSKTIGPLLNGWRTALAEPPGTLLIVRSADLIDFQRAAPDLASFIGPKITDASTILFLWGRKTATKIKTTFPKAIIQILKKLPGELPTKKEIDIWLAEHPPID